MSPADPDASPILVIGNGRSGTTLLRMMLCAHPRIHLTQEASFWLWEPQWRGRSAPDWLGFYVGGFSYRWLRQDPRPLLAGLPAPFGMQHRRDFYRAVMKARAAEHGKPRFGDKTPGHSANLARVFEDFPDARVIRMVRDPRWTVRSMGRMPWSTANLVAASLLCRMEHKQVAPFRDRILEVKLEELLAEPRTTMERVLEFVGEGWSDQVLDHAAHAPDDLPPVPWFQAASGPRESKRPYAAFGSLELRLTEFLNRRAMRDHGYVRQEVEREPGRLRLVLRWFAELPGCVRFLWIAGQMLKLAKRPGGSEDPRSKELGRRLNPPAWDLYPDFEMPDPPPLPEGWEEALPEG